MLSRLSEKGFTASELVVVIGVIAILVGIAVPAYYNYIEQGKISEAQSDLKRIEAALISLGTDTMQWPLHGEPGVTTSGPSNEVYDLNAANAGLVATDGNFPNWNGPYIPSVPVDPWGNNYFYDQDYQINGVDNPVLGSFGPDGCCPNNYNTGDDVLVVLPLR